MKRFGAISNAIPWRASQSVGTAPQFAQILCTLQQLLRLSGAARRYDTFWDSGGEALARAALAPDFIDNTLPSGRAQGVAGVLKASSTFRTAVPDLRCEVEQMIVAGDRVVTQLHFTGHFTGSFMGKAGQGQRVDFIATDIYRISDGRIAEDWHLEDNLTFLQQIGFVAR